MTDPIEKIKKALSQRVVSRPSLNGNKPAAVLVPLYFDGSEWRMVFTKRTDKVETHKGQISFPGGSRDPEDSSFSETALRETEEEIGVVREEIELIGRLDPLVTVTGYQIHPFVGIIPYPYKFKLNKFEVDRLIELSLDRLIEEANDQVEKVVSGLDLNFNRRADLIWGATARILYQLIQVSFL